MKKSDDLIPLGSAFDDPKERKRFEDEKISYSQYLSRLQKQAAPQAKPEYCYYCAKPKKGFCDSHSVPQFCLRRIADMGKVLHTAGFMDTPMRKPELGVNSAGTFQIICQDCDSKIFAEYENPGNYTTPPTQKMLAQIAMKNYLHSVHKRRYEVALFEQMLTEARSYQKSIELEIRIASLISALQTHQLDLQMYENEFQRAKANLDNSYPAALPYEVISFINLEYVVPIAFQENILLVSDFSGNTINDIFDKSLPLEKFKDIHIAVFPLEQKSVVFLFYEKPTACLTRFEGVFRNKPVEEQLATINFIMFAYSENVFVSKEIPDIIRKNTALRDIARLTSMYQSSSAPRKEALRKYALGNRRNIPNLLSPRFAVR